MNSVCTIQVLTRVDLADEDWRAATKTIGLRALTNSELFGDIPFEIHTKLLLTIKKGVQPIDLDSVMCIGPGGNVWQQKATALQNKYDCQTIQEGEWAGWMECTPMPGNSIECFKYTGQPIYLQGTWGEKIDGLGENLQRLKTGDFVCRQPHDHNAILVVIVVSLRTVTRSTNKVWPVKKLKREEHSSLFSSVSLE